MERTQKDIREHLDAIDLLRKIESALEHMYACAKATPELGRLTPPSADDMEDAVGDPHQWMALAMMQGKRPEMPEELGKHPLHCGVEHAEEFRDYLLQQYGSFLWNTPDELARPVREPRRSDHHG